MTQPNRVSKHIMTTQHCIYLDKPIYETKPNPLKAALECFQSDAGPQLHMTVSFNLLRPYQYPLHRLAVTCMPKQSERFASPQEHLNQECIFSPSKWQQLMLCVIKCVSDALHVCGLSPETHVAPFSLTKL